MRIDDDVKQTVRDGAVQAYRLLQWFRTAPPDPGVVEPVMRGPTTVLTLAVAAAVLIVGVLIFLGVIAITLKLFESGVAPTLNYLSGRIFRLVLVPGALPALAVATVVVGLAVARKFQPQGLFLTGVFVVALGFVCLWQLPRVIAALPTPEARVQLEAPLLIVGLIISTFLLVCGVQVTGHCQWARGDEARDKTE